MHYSCYQLKLKHLYALASHSRSDLSPPSKKNKSNQRKVKTFLKGVSSHYAHVSIKKKDGEYDLIHHWKQWQANQIKTFFAEYVSNHNEILIDKLSITLEILDNLEKRIKTVLQKKDVYISMSLLPLDNDEHIGSSVTEYNTDYYDTLEISLIVISIAKNEIAKGTNVIYHESP